MLHFNFDSFFLKIFSTWHPGSRAWLRLKQFFFSLAFFFFLYFYLFFLFVVYCISLLWPSFPDFTFLGQWWSGSECELYIDPSDLPYISNEHALVIMNHKYDIDWLMGWIIIERFGMLGVRTRSVQLGTCAHHLLECFGYLLLETFLFLSISFPSFWFFYFLCYFYF